MVNHVNLKGSGASKGDQCVFWKHANTTHKCFIMQSMLCLWHRLKCLPDKYAGVLRTVALRLVHIYQAKHECL